MSADRPKFSKRDGQLGFGAGLAADLALMDQQDVLQTPPPVNPAVAAQEKLLAKLERGEVPNDRSGVDRLVYDA